MKRKTKMKGKAKYLILSIVAVLFLIACGFLGVHLYNKSQVESAVYRDRKGQLFCFACSHWMDCCLDSYMKQKVSHDITNISAKSGPVKNVWIVETTAECPGGEFFGKQGRHWHGTGPIRTVAEYSFYEGKLQYLRTLQMQGVLPEDKPSHLITLTDYSPRNK